MILNLFALVLFFMFELLSQYFAAFGYVAQWPSEIHTAGGAEQWMVAFCASWWEPCEELHVIFEQFPAQQFLELIVTIIRFNIIITMFKLLRTNLFRSCLKTLENNCVMDAVLSPFCHLLSKGLPP